MIEHSREKDQKVHVYGVSYGTYWAQRYLQLFPKQAEAVTLDSVCQSGLCSISKNIYWFDEVTKRFLRECADDAFCAERLGPDPVAKVREAMAKADAGGCVGSNLDGATLRWVFTWFITNVDLRVLIPSTSYRILRCNEDDVAALNTMSEGLSSMLGSHPAGEEEKEDLSSDALFYNVSLSPRRVRRQVPGERHEQRTGR